jgi:hypothetical protein
MARDSRGRKAQALGGRSESTGFDHRAEDAHRLKFIHAIIPNYATQIQL